MVSKKGLKLGGEQQKLTAREEQVFKLLTVDFLTVKQASNVLACSLQAVYKIRKSIKNKGFLHAIVPKEMQVEKSGGCIQPFQPFSANQKNPIRLHAEQFVINILWKNKNLKVGTTFYDDGNHVRVNEDSVEVYSNTSFEGESPVVCDARALKYWYRFFNKLQDSLKVILLKNGSLNVRRVRAEYAEVGNELAKMSIKEDQRLRCYGEDGKQWLVFDNSFNLSECETVDPKRSRFDMQEAVQPFFNDLRKHPVTLTDVKRSIDALAKQNLETAAGLNVVVDLMKPKEDKEDVSIVPKRMWYHG